MIGTRLAHYEITAPLGKGGMGEVFRARDTKLGREVALKVLPEAFARDPQRMGRFAREAQVLAALNHPHIAAVYGLEEDGDRKALVMELVEGETLEARIAKGPVPLAETARIGLELARAIEAAHTKGIIHRDLKPANVMLTGDGEVKVLDFGLAKALEEERSPEDLANSPTLTSPATAAGIILGTAAYMSPEQAAGSPADPRADIWSYGVVLTEMLSGRRQFGGETVSHTLASVLKDEPEWEDLEGRTPRRILRLLRRCLQKDPKQRLQAIGEARVLWEEYLADPDAFATTGPAMAAPWWSRALPWSVAAVALLALGWSFLRPGTATTPERGPRRLTIPIELQTNWAGGITSVPAISPDGTKVAFGMSDEEGVQRIWLRPLDSFDARPLAGTEGGQMPFWSPDSREVGFFVADGLRRVDTATGQVRPIVDADATAPRGAHWGQDNVVVYSPDPNSPILAIDLDQGGPVRPVSVLDDSIPDVSHRWPQLLPDGEHLLYLLWTNDVASQALHGGTYVARVDGTGDPVHLLTDPFAARYADGHLLVVQVASLVAIPFEPGRPDLRGQSTVIANDVLVNRNVGAGVFSASDEGTLVFAPILGSVPEATLHWVNRDGVASPTPVEPGEMFPTLRLSPDASRVTTLMPGATGDPEVWVIDLIRGVRTRVTPPSSWVYSSPLFSPDGRQIYYVSAEKGVWDIYGRNVDGAGGQREFIISPFDKVVYDVVAQKALVWEDTEGPGSAIGVVDLATGEMAQLLRTGDPASGRLSPDARHIVYSNTESGRDEVSALSLETGSRWQVSTQGGLDPAWRADGREIVYMDPRRQMMAVRVDETGDRMELGQPERLFELDDSTLTWDATADHSRFLVATRPSSGGEPLRIVMGWNQGL